MSYIVGLTGGIGCGKTVVSDYLGSLGVPVIDTDVIAREIVRPGQPALDALVSEFGAHILLENGELNRDKLRGIAFSSKRNKQNWMPSRIRRFVVSVRNKSHKLNTFTD